jgi:CBS domain containing-hemolysin-like protein
VSEWLGRVPEPGEEIVIDGTPVEIESLDGGAVSSLIVGERPQPFQDQPQ